jgi:hypothetical protein
MLKTEGERPFRVAVDGLAPALPHGGLPPLYFPSSLCPDLRLM